MQGKIVLYHGSPNRIITPTYGLGEEKHDYGKGFYLTENMKKLINSDKNKVTNVFSTLI